MSIGSDFQRAVASWAEGAWLELVARSPCGELTFLRMLARLDGDFWKGRIRALSLGQNNRTAPAVVIPRLGIHGFEFLDGRGGIGLGRVTCFPVRMAWGASLNPSLEIEIGEGIGKELRAKGGTLFGRLHQSTSRPSMG